MSSLELYETLPASDNAPSPKIEDERGEEVAPPHSHRASDMEEEAVQQAEEAIQPRRSMRTPAPRRRFDIDQGGIFLAAQEGVTEPRTVAEALSGSDAKEWIGAMQEEMDSMRKNQVWDLVDLPPGRKTVGNKWVLKIKRKADGSVERFKARLVAKG